MSAYAKLSEKRKAQLNNNIASHRARLRAMPPALAACWKIRSKISGEPDPYTPDERKRAEAIRAEISKLEAKAAALHAEVLARLSLDATPEGEAIHEAVAGAKGIQVILVF